MKTINVTNKTKEKILKLLKAGDFKTPTQLREESRLWHYSVISALAKLEEDGEIVKVSNGHTKFYKLKENAKPTN